MKKIKLFIPIITIVLSIIGLFIYVDIISAGGISIDENWGIINYYLLGGWKTALLSIIMLLILISLIIGIATIKKTKILITCLILSIIGFLASLTEIIIIGFNLENSVSYEVGKLTVVDVIKYTDFNGIFGLCSLVITVTLASLVIILIINMIFNIIKVKRN